MSVIGVFAAPVQSIEDGFNPITAGSTSGFASNVGIGSGGVTSSGGYWYLNSGPAYLRPPPPWTPPSRAELLRQLKASGSITALTKGGQPVEGEEFDLLIVGGGATGAGCAVDAASRGLKVALVERDDFSSGTVKSSKSTKLVHGGVRYLQKAVFELDYDQYKLMLPIMLPIYKYWQVPYYLAGCKMYDILAGKENMETSYLMSKGKALETFPMLKSDGLVGALVYYDGQHNDSRMNMALIMTAVKLGATVVNYCEVTQLHKNSNGKLNGVRVKDNLTGEQWNIKAKGIINATGPFTDALLLLDNPNHEPIVQPSSGVHITLPNYYSPRKMGLLDPATSDGRVIFFLPWQGNTIAGTTDTPAKVTRDPEASEEDIRWLLEEVRRYLSPDIKVRRGDVLSAWSGLRPLVRDPSAEKTEGLVRNHMINVSPSRLVTIAGGKWTTYRAMAEETVDEAIKTFGLKPKNGCVTQSLRLVGSEGWSRNMFIGLIQTYGLETHVAKHLSENYGDRAWTVCSLAEPTGLSWPLYGKRLVSQYPIIDAEVRYAVRHEYALTAIDVLARRTRLSFLNARLALDALPQVVDIMAEELGWSLSERQRQIDKAVNFFGSMGLSPAYVATHRPRPIPRGTWEKVQTGLWDACIAVANTVRPGKTAEVTPAEGFASGRSKFEPGEISAIRNAFVAHKNAAEEKVHLNEVLDVLKDVPGYAEVSEKELDYVLNEAGLTGQVEFNFDEFIEISGNLKEIMFAPSPPKSSRKRMIIPVEKSGGGV
ncbi:DAO-domain-containing protein [Gymnopilus junonius]|uniref:Glycerol-3-phosphate dehydrogenase n=1 Tax=Gymnopilus junonius TaxID=109634 RepID=A0A9P5TEF7_GYMJU|nr:DAO-domain-containing protein [Gymnopilus junonius]